MISIITMWYFAEPMYMCARLPVYLSMHGPLRLTPHFLRKSLPIDPSIVQYTYMSVHLDIYTSICLELRKDKPYVGRFRLVAAAELRDMCQGFLQYRQYPHRL